MSSTFFRSLLEETSSSDIATIDTKLNLVRRTNDKMFVCEKCGSKIKRIEEAEKTLTKELTEAQEQKVEDILRNNGIKVKSVIKTKFGTQIDLFKVPENLKDILKDIKFQIDSKSIFVYN